MKKRYLFLLSALLLSGCSNDNVYSIKDNKVEYGYYPQSIVTDESIISTLKNITETNKQGYIEHNKKMYAKVETTFSQEEIVLREGVKLIKGNTYYFEVETITWNILKNSEETYYLMTEKIIDCQQYAKYENNYKNSYVRQFLNNDFINKAFKDTSYIVEENVDNSKSSTIDADNYFACENTSDKVYLLSYQDMKNAEYGFSLESGKDEKRIAYLTDYAIAKGAWKNDQNAGWYWTRSPNNVVNYSASSVAGDGALTAGHYVYYQSAGIRPAITFKVK